MRRFKVHVEFHKDFMKIDGDMISVGLKSKPEKGKANAELVKKLAKNFRLPPSKIRIVAGFKSKNKIIEILD